PPGRPGPDDDPLRGTRRPRRRRARRRRAARRARRRLRRAVWRSGRGSAQRSGGRPGRAGGRWRPAGHRGRGGAGRGWAGGVRAARAAPGARRGGGGEGRAPRPGRGVRGQRHRPARQRPVRAGPGGGRGRVGPIRVRPRGLLALHGVRALVPRGGAQARAHLHARVVGSGGPRLRAHPGRALLLRGRPLRPRCSRPAEWERGRQCPDPHLDLGRGAVLRQEGLRVELRGVCGRLQLRDPVPAQGRGGSEAAAPGRAQERPPGHDRIRRRRHSGRAHAQPLPVAVL
ncbi:unnamed protein product, partial [Prorocentrum cordatum]